MQMHGALAAGDRALAKEAARPLGELGAGGPADVVALRALVEGGAALVVADGSAVTAVQALHLAKPNLHAKEKSAFRRTCPSLERGSRRRSETRVSETPGGVAELFPAGELHPRPPMGLTGSALQ